MSLMSNIASGADRLNNAALRSTEKFGDGAGTLGSKLISATFASVPGVAIAAGSAYLAADKVMPALERAWNTPTDPNYTVDFNKVGNVALDVVALGGCAAGFVIGATTAVRGAAKALGSKKVASIEE